MHAFAYGRCQVQAAALNDNVNVVARAAKEAVAHVASYDKGPYAHPGGLLGNYPEYGLVKEAFSLYTGHCTMVWFG